MGYNFQVSINAGIRYSMLNALGPRTYYTYQEGILPSMSSVADSITAGNGKVIKTYHGPEFRCRHVMPLQMIFP